MTAEEVFAALTPPKQPSLLGAYAGFFLGPLRERLPATDLPVALRWAASQQPRDDGENPFRHTIEHFLRMAWNYLEDYRVLEPFALAVAERLAAYVEVPGLEVGEAARGSPRDSDAESA